MRGGRGSFLDFVEKQETATAAVASIEDAAECGERADGLVSGVLGRVMRQRRSIAAALDYVRALSRGTRANCWELAEAAGHEGPHRMHALLRRYRWSWEKLRGALAGLAAQCLPDDPDDLIGPGIAIDETAHLKKGRATACVSPQHAGVTGKAGNCVTWVFAALVTALGQVWADFDVYMPGCWAADPHRRRRAGIPGDLKFATKPELAINQLRRLMAAGVRALRAAADEVYRRRGEFRDACRALSLAYVVIIPCDYRVTLAKDTVIGADQAISDAVFERRSCGNGTKGPRYSDWALIATACPREFLLIRRLPSRVTAEALMKPPTWVSPHACSCQNCWTACSSMSGGVSRALFICGLSRVRAAEHQHGVGGWLTEQLHHGLLVETALVGDVDEVSYRGAGTVDVH